MEERTVSGLGYLAGAWPLDAKKATLVFIHGAGGSSAFWKLQVEALQDRYNTVALDLPGHGRSQGPGREKITEYAAKVVEFIDLIQAPRPVLAGLSMGGAITQQILLDYPGRFPIAILLSTGARLKVLPMIFDTIAKNYPGFVLLMAKFAVSAKTPPEKYQDALADTAAQPPASVASDFRACDVFDVRERLAEISVPVLILSAQDDLLTPPAYAEFLESGIRGSQRVHFQDAGHLIPVEKPEAVNEAIISFLSAQGF